KSRLRRPRWPAKYARSWTPLLRSESQYPRGTGRGTAIRPGKLLLVRRIFGDFRFADGGKRLHVETTVIGVARHLVDFEAFQEQNPGANVGFLVRGKPDFVVEEGLFEDKAGAFLQIGEKAAGEANVFDKVGFEAGNVVRLFIHPDHSGQLLDDAFFELFGLVFGISFEIENQDILPAEALAPRIYELTSAQEKLYARFVGVFSFFSLRLGFFFLFFFVCFLFLMFVVSFLFAFIFFVLFVFAKRLPVSCHERGDFLSVQIEKRFLAAIELADFAGAIVLSFFDRSPAGVILF